MNEPFHSSDFELNRKLPDGSTASAVTPNEILSTDASIDLSATGGSGSPDLNSRGKGNPSSTVTAARVVTGVSSEYSFELNTNDAVPTEGSVAPAEATIVSAAPPFEIVSAGSEEKTAEPDPLPEHFLASGSLPIGTRLGHFVITKYIGGGGMGRVYEGVDKALDRKVAIKVLPRQRAQDSTSVARFLNEARSAARLNHEHIAQVYFCGEERGIPYIAFEYVEGVNVRHYVENHGPMPLPLTIKFLLQISGALAHAAGHGVTHRDVKPSNILITPQGKAKLIDMGLARLLRPSDPEDDLTVSGVTLGTFDYISPEQARDPRLADVRSDIYSLGCTFFFMLTGQPPFPEGTVLQKLLKHQGDEPPDVRTFVPDMPAEAVAVIQKMMAKDPLARYQTPNELIDDLSTVARSMGLRPTGPDRTNWTIPAPVKTSPFLRHLPWVSAVLILLALVAGIYFLSQTQDESAMMPKINAPEPPQPAIPGRGANVEEPAPEPEPPEEKPVFLPQILGTDESSVRPVAGSEAFRGSPIFANGFPSQNDRLYGGLGAVPIQLSAALADALTDAQYLNLTRAEQERIRRTVSAASSELSDQWTFRREPASEDRSVNKSADAANRVTLTVDRVGTGPDRFATLKEALDESLRRGAQANETVIEFAFDGSLPSAPILLENRAYRWTAREGFSPSLVFRTEETAEKQAAIRLADAQLTLNGISVDFEPARETAADATLFELTDGAALSVSSGIFTIYNSALETGIMPARPGAAFFKTLDSARAPSETEPQASEIASSAQTALNAQTTSNTQTTSKDLPSQNTQTALVAQSASNMDTVTSSEVFSGTSVLIHLDRIFLRGEAAGTVVESGRALRFEMTACGFNLTEPLVTVRYAARGTESEKIFVLIDRTIGVSHSVLFRQERQSAYDRSGTLNASVRRSLLKFDGTPAGETLTEGYLPENLPRPDWNFSESILYDLTPTVQYRSLARPDENQSVELPTLTPRAFDPSRPEAAQLATKPPSRFSPAELSEFLLTPAYGNLHTLGEKNTLDAIESALFHSSNDEK